MHHVKILCQIDETVKTTLPIKYWWWFISGQSYIFWNYKSLVQILILLNISFLSIHPTRVISWYLMYWFQNCGLFVSCNHKKKIKILDLYCAVAFVQILNTKKLRINPEIVNNTRYQPKSWHNFNKDYMAIIECWFYGLDANTTNSLDKIEI